MAYKNMKIMLILLVVSTSAFFYSMEDNPFEQYEFSQRDNVVKWLSPELCNDEKKLSQVQKWIFEGNPQNPEVLRNKEVFHRVDNNSGDYFFYGRTFPFMVDPQSEYLQKVKNEYERTESDSFTVLEFAAAGAFSYFLSLIEIRAKKFVLVINDLSKPEIEKLKSLFENRDKKLGIFPRDYSNNIIFDVGDIITISGRLPITGNVNFCRGQNLCHFLSPNDHQRLLKVLLTLLMPGGIVSLLAHTIPDGYGVKGHPYHTEYVKGKKKKDNIYPACLKYVTTAYEHLNVDGAFYHCPNLEVKVQAISNDYMPSCKSTRLDSGKYEGQDCRMVKQCNYRNAMTPRIYQNALKKAAKDLGLNVELISSYFVDNDGKGHQEYVSNRGMLFACIMMEKINS